MFADLATGRRVECVHHGWLASLSKLPWRPFASPAKGRFFIWFPIVLLCIDRPGVPVMIIALLGGDGDEQLDVGLQFLALVRVRYRAGTVTPSAIAVATPE